MKKSFREFFICPYCESEINFFIDEGSGEQYECYTACNVCSRPSRFVDTPQRCVECNFKVSCLGKPVQIICAHRINIENIEGEFRA